MRLGFFNQGGGSIFLQRVNVVNYLREGGGGGIAPGETRRASTCVYMHLPCAHILRAHFEVNFSGT